MATKRGALAGDSAETEAIDFATFYHDGWLRMVRLATFLLGDLASAEDVVQEAFMNVYRKRARLVDRARANSYLSTAVVNACRSRHRHRKVVTLALRRLAPRSESVEDASTAPAPDIFDALKALPRRQREVVVLRYWADISEAEAARILSISVGAVKSSASRGLGALRASLGDSYAQH